MPGDDGGTAPDELAEEPQEERGAPGSRDKGEGPGGGPTDRPTGRSDADDVSSVNPQEPIDEESPHLQPGGG